MIECNNFFGNIIVMPVPWFRFSVLADGVDGLEDPNQSDVSMTHSSEITENIDIQWISVLSLREKQYTASRSCSVVDSCIDWIIKMEEKFSNVSITNHKGGFFCFFFFTFSLHSSEYYKTNKQQTNKDSEHIHTHTHKTPENHKTLKLWVAYVWVLIQYY